MPQDFDEWTGREQGKLMEGAEHYWGDPVVFKLGDMARLTALENLLRFNVQQGTLKLPPHKNDH